MADPWWMRHQSLLPGLTAAQPMPAPAMPAAAPAERPQLGLLDRVFGSGVPSGLLSNEQRAPLGRNALLQGGLAALKESVTPGHQANLGSALVAGLQGGMGAYQTGVESQIGAEQYQLQQKKAQLRSMIQQKYAGRTDDESLKAMMGDLIAMGDVEAAKPISEYLKSRGGNQSRANLMQVKAGNTIKLVDPHTGEVVREYDDPEDPLTKYQRQAAERADKTAARMAEDRIRDNLRQNTTAARAAAQGYAVLKAASTNSSAASPIALLYAYGKLLDPGSVVREGELATLQRIGAYDDKVKGWLTAAATGKMTQEIRDAIWEEAQRIAKAHADTYQDYLDEAKSDAERWGVSGMSFVNPFERFGLGSSSAPSGGAANVRKALTQ